VFQKSKCEQNVFLRVMLIRQSYRIGQKSDISLVVFSPGSAKTNIEWGGKLSSHLMASCVRNIHTNICTKHQFIHLLTATCNVWHIEKQQKS